MASTLIQVLHLLPESIIDKPSTAAFEHWKIAIDYFVECTGVSHTTPMVYPRVIICMQWTNLAWGHHHESPVHVTLIAGFKTSQDVQSFLSTNYSTFLGFVQPLVASQPSPPAVTDHLPILDPRKITTISKLTFLPLEGDGGGIIWRYKGYVHELQAAARHETGSVYTGATAIAKWAVDDDETVVDKERTRK